MMRGIVITKDHLSLTVHIMIPVFVDGDGAMDFSCKDSYFDARGVYEYDIASYIYGFCVRGKIFLDCGGQDNGA